MPSIAKFLTAPEQGWKQGVGPNFYYPPGDDIPHLHLVVTNASAPYEGWQNLNLVKNDRGNGFSLTHRPGKGNLDLTQSGSESDAKIAEAIVKTGWGDEQCRQAVEFVNEITGRNVELPAG